MINVSQNANIPDVLGFFLVGDDFVDG